MVDERKPAYRRPSSYEHLSAMADAERMALAGADVAGEREARTATVEAPLLDPRDPLTSTRLGRRLASGAYEISEPDLVRAIRAWHARGEQARARDLSEVLARRCLPEFQKRCWGLRHQPQLMEDAISGMVEQLLREALDPREEFMLLNFIHYLHCLAADNFTRVLRQEGLSYRRDEQGRPAGRPQHVPRALIDRIDVEAEEREDGGAAGHEIVSPEDPMGTRLAAMEAERILGYLSDPMDRQIMVLRVLEQMRWDDIARICGKTERTMRLRFEKARALLRDRLAEEVAIE
jgi:DNA-directed RNA polymerase specialized sigma24 family protein